MSGFSTSLAELAIGPFNVLIARFVFLIGKLKDEVDVKVRAKLNLGIKCSQQTALFVSFQIRKVMFDYVVLDILALISLDFGLMIEKVAL